jgi:RNA polymerase sigma-70 factor, ECF subfamily
MSAESPGRETPQDAYRDFESLVRALNDQMARCAYRIVGNRHDAQDVVQEAFMKIWRHWSQVGRFNTFAQQRAYVSKAVSNKAVETVRKASKRRELPGGDMRIFEPMPNGHDEHSHDTREDLHFAWTVISKLPEGCREATTLYAAGYEYPEIAEMLNIAVGTVRSHVSQARRRLREARLRAREDGLL